MNDIWYYSDRGKSVGPVSLADLTAILSRVSNEKNVLVWRDGFDNWKKAQNVPELMALVIKPPPLPPLPPPLPPLLPNLPGEPLVASGVVKDNEVRPQYKEQRADRVRANEADFVGSQSSDTNRSKVTGAIASAVVIVMVAAMLRFLSHSGGETSAPAPASLISGKVREAFVAEGMKTCMEKQESDPENVRLSLSKDSLAKYCSCFMNKLADSATHGDLRSDGFVAPAWQKKADAATTSCPMRPFPVVGMTAGYLMRQWTG